MSVGIQVLRCEGAFGLVRTPHAFTFRVFPDMWMSVDVTPLAAAVTVDSHEAPPPQQEQAHAQDQDQAEPPQEDTAPVTYTVLDARAQRDDGMGNCFDIEFTLIRWSSGRFDSAVMKCVARMSPVDGVTGRFLDLSQALTPEDPGVDFKLALSAAEAGVLEEQPLMQQLFPLTPGSYELQGCTLGGNGYMYECAVQIELLPDGVLRGTSRELLFPQECSLQGLWRRDQMSYMLQYRVNANSCTYVYFGWPILSGMRGSWQNANIAAREHPAESGVLEFRLVRCRRVWSEAAHLDYPLPFRQSVKLLLLASLRGCASDLPSHLWREILSYCDYDWFGVDTFPDQDV